MHHGAPEADAEEQVVIIRKLLPEAVKLLAERCGCHVVLEERRQARGIGEALADVDVLPADHRRGADEAHGFDVEGSRQRQAGTQQTAAAKACLQLGDHLFDQRESVVRIDSRRRDGGCRQRHRAG